jgi:putative two-component system response regulator
MSEQSKILIVDDEPITRMTLEGLLSIEAYKLFFAEDGLEGLGKAIAIEPDVILLDVMLPKLNGFDVCRQIRSLPRLADIPILMISTLDDRDSRLSGLRAGADDFISKPFDTLELLARLASLTRLNRFRRIVEQRTELDRLHSELVVAYDKTIEGWANALDLRDKETEGHTRRVTEKTVQLARAIGISESMIPHIYRGALLHDIGKLGIPDAILLKPGKLDDDEWRIMRMHTVYAYNWLSPIEYLHPALDIPYCHHEKWDGSGYPRGLSGEDIPIAARIFALVDVFDAITHDRPYHHAMPVDEACVLISSGAGNHFDPKLTEDFLKLVS